MTPDVRTNGTPITPAWRISLKTLLADYTAMAGRVKYKLGEKPAITMPVGQIDISDCSGFTRRVIGVGTDGKIRLPPGSQEQRMWALQQRLRRLLEYSDVQYAKDDPSRLFLAVLSPPAGKAWPRHVWLVRQGKTLECCSSRGVGSRPWDTPILLAAQWCFELPTIP